MSRNLLQILSIFALLYVGFLIAISNTSFQNQLFRAVAELITIPTIMFAFGCFLFSIFKLLRKEKSYLPTFVINLATILLIIYSVVM